MSSSKLRKRFRNINGPAGIFGGKAKSKSCVLEHFPEVTIEAVEPTESGGLLQKEGAKSEMLLHLHWSSPFGLNRVIPLFYISEWDRSDVPSMELMQVHTLFFTEDYRSINRY